MAFGRSDGAPPIDGMVQTRLEKGRARHNIWKPRWAEQLAFVEGRQFVFTSRQSGQAVLHELETWEGGQKQPYQARTVENRILGFYLGELSAGTQRTPQWEVIPTSTDPDVINAARLGEKVLQYLYDYLDYREALIVAYGYAISCGEGFVRPYWNSKGGDPLPTDPANPEEKLYTGDVCLEAFGPQEIYWEAGAGFHQSPWHAIERTQHIDYLKSLPHYIGGDLKPDANSNQSFVQGQLDKKAARGDMALTTEYLQLPTEGNPEGRRLVIANGKQITQEEAYPLSLCGPEGYRPCIHKVTYIPTPWRDRDMGLVEHAIDPQRTINDCRNKAIEHKNLLLMPRMVVGPAGVRDRITTSPGQVIRSDGDVNTNIKVLDTPPIPQSLFDMMDRAIGAMEEIFSQRSVPQGVEAGKAIAALTERDSQRRQFVIQSLADFHGEVGEHLLYLVQNYWDEPRLLQIEGRHGLEFIPDFKGASLRQQIAAKCLPTSIEPRTREAIEQKIFNLAQLGWIDRDQGLAAINGGTAEALVETYELNIAKQEREIQQMIAMGSEALPGGGAPIVAPFDDHQIHLGVLHQWMLTAEFERQPPMVQEAAVAHEQQHQMYLQQQQMQEIMQQNQVAEQQGMNNATRPAGQKPNPSLPKAGGASSSTAS